MARTTTNTLSTNTQINEKKHTYRIGPKVITMLLLNYRFTRKSVLLGRT